MTNYQFYFYLCSVILSRKMTDSDRLQIRLTASPNAKGLIFDLDGTLIDDLGIHWQAWQKACKHFGVDVEHDFFIALTGKPVASIAQLLIEHYRISATVEEIVRLKESFVYQHLNEAQPIKPVVDIVHDNYGRLPMAIGTGSDRPRAMLMLRNAGIDTMFDVIVCAEDVENHKPAPDTFLRCAEMMNVSPEECQVFEDGQFGLDAARAANMIVTDIKPYITDN